MADCIRCTRVANCSVESLFRICSRDERQRERCQPIRLREYNAPQRKSSSVLFSRDSSSSRSSTSRRAWAAGIRRVVTRVNVEQEAARDLKRFALRLSPGNPGTRGR